jgi:ParB/RepB/Spo0J family partition protein
MSRTIDLPLDVLNQDPDNARRHFSGIPQMADSIAILGLLENLVVVKDPKRAGQYIVKAGNRRFRALCLLRDRKVFLPNEPISCKVLDKTDGVLEALAENEAREDVPPWEVGAKYVELHERGMGQKEIAAAVGKSQQHVSLCMTLARYLAPKVITTLNQLGKSRPNLIELGRLAELIDKDTLGPDEEKQVKRLEQILGTPKRARPPTPREKKVESLHMERFRMLQETAMPEHAAVYWTAFERFVLGKDEILTLPKAPRIARVLPPKKKVKRKAA